MRPDPDLSQVHFTTIDGEEIQYQVHKRGLRKGSIHTAIGDFVSMEELGRYVRARQEARRVIASRQISGEDPS